MHAGRATRMQLARRIGTCGRRAVDKLSGCVAAPFISGGVSPSTWPENYTVLSFDLSVLTVYARPSSIRIVQVCRFFDRQKGIRCDSFLAFSPELPPQLSAASPSHSATGKAPGKAVTGRDPQARRPAVDAIVHPGGVPRATSVGIRHPEATHVCAAEHCGWPRPRSPRNASATQARGR